MAKVKHLPSDFRPIKGDSTRKYQNIKTGEIISRRRYDETYGAARQFGTYEKKSKINEEIDPLLHFARPSRGKPSKIKETKKMTGEEKSQFILSSKSLKQSHELSKKNQRIYDRKTNRLLKQPKKINTKTFTKGKRSMWRDYYTRPDYDSMLDFLILAKSDKRISRYQIGFEVLNEKRSTTYPMTIIQLRDFSVPFTYEDYESMVANIEERGYIQIIAGVVRIFGDL